MSNNGHGFCTFYTPTILCSKTLPTNYKAKFTGQWTLNSRNDRDFFVTNNEHSHLRTKFVLIMLDNGAGEEGQSFE
jgi:hypothetical protein